MSDVIVPSRAATRRDAGVASVAFALGVLLTVTSCQSNVAIDSGSACVGDADCGAASVDAADAVPISDSGDIIEDAATVAAPSLDAFTPLRQGAGGEVILTGNNLANPTHVTFGSGPDARVTASSATSITAIVPIGATSGNVTVTTAGGTTSLPGFNYTNVISCAGFTRTIVETYPWVADTGINPTGTTGTGLMRDMAYVGIIQVPATAPSSPGNAGRISVAEYIDAPHRRWATISTSPCTWGTPGDGFTKYEIEPTFYFTIGANAVGEIPMTPGNTYYLNVQMTDPVTMANQCGTGSCNIIAEFFKPPGT